MASDIRTGAGEYRLASSLRIILLSLLASLAVSVLSLLMQWVVYDDLLHRTGPLRITGSTLATILAFIFSYRWQLAARERRREMLRRFDTISQMNDKIRNALQAIECITYVSRPDATREIRHAVDRIEIALSEVLSASSSVTRSPADEPEKKSVKRSA